MKDLIDVSKKDFEGDNQIYFVDYDKKYNEGIDLLDESYWGDFDTIKPSVSSIIKENDIVKLAVIDDKVIGLLHFKPIGDLIDCYHILVSEKYQKQGIASKLFEEAMIEIELGNFSTLIAHAVEHNGKVNAKNLLEKFGFKEIYKVKDYWKSLYPNDFCKKCNSNDCHCGVVVFLKNMQVNSE